MNDTVDISTIEDIVAEVIKNADYETLLRLNQVGKQYVKILNEPFILSYLANKWLDKSHASEVKSFDDLVDFRENYHFTPRCLQYRNTSQCLKLSAKDGNLPFISEYLRMINDDLLNELIVIAIKNYNIDIIDFLLPHVIDANYIAYQAAFLNDITTVKKILNKYNVDYNNILLGAASGDNLDIVKYVINLPEGGATAIQPAFTEAVKNNSFNTVKYLLENYRNDINVLMSSSFSKSAKMLELLSLYTRLNADYLWPDVYLNYLDDITLWLLEKRLITEIEIYEFMTQNLHVDLLKKLLDLKIYPPGELIIDILRKLFEQNQFDLMLILLPNVPSDIKLTDITGEQVILNNEQGSFLEQLLNPNDCYITVSDSNKYSTTYLINNYKLGINIIYTQYFSYPTYVDDLISLMNFDK
jgi:hypothetical protein